MGTTSTSLAGVIVAFSRSKRVAWRSDEESGPFGTFRCTFSPRRGIVSARAYFRGFRFRQLRGLEGLLPASVALLLDDLAPAPSFVATIGFDSGAEPAFRADLDLEFPARVNVLESQWQLDHVVGGVKIEDDEVKFGVAAQPSTEVVGKLDNVDAELSGRLAPDESSVTVKLRPTNVEELPETWVPDWLGQLTRAFRLTGYVRGCPDATS